MIEDLLLNCYENNYGNNYEINHLLFVSPCNHMIRPLPKEVKRVSFNNTALIIASEPVA